MNIRSWLPKGVGPTLVTNGVVIILQMVSGIIIARLLGPTGRGQLAVALIWASTMAMLGSLGVKEAIVFYTANKKRQEGVLPNAFLIAAFQSCILVGAGWLLLPLILKKVDPDTLQNVRISLFFIPLSFLTQYSIGTLQGRLRVKSLNSIRLLVPMAYVSSLGMLYFLDMISVRCAVLSLLLANFLATLISFLIVTYDQAHTWKFEKKTAADLISYGIRSHLGSVTNNLNQRLDQILISIFLAPNLLGLYVVGVSISGIVNIIPLAFFTIMFPKVARAEDIESANHLIQHYFFRSLILVLVAGGLVFVLIPVLLPLIYGVRFLPSILPARILVMAAICASARDILSYGHRALNNPVVASKSEILGLAATGIFLLVLLPRLGISGAAVASLIAYTVSLVYNIYMMKRLYGLKFINLIRPVIAH